MKSTDTTGESKYARKVRGKKQMYGPGCCGHKHAKDILEGKPPKQRGE